MSLLMLTSTSLDNSWRFKCKILTKTFIKKIALHTIFSVKSWEYVNKHNSKTFDLRSNVFSLILDPEFKEKVWIIPIICILNINIDMLNHTLHGLHSWFLISPLSRSVSDLDVKYEVDHRRLHWLISRENDDEDDRVIVVGEDQDES